MTKLKQIMLKIARLPSSDQRWILRKLSSDKQETLQQWQGLKLLQEARRFRKLKPKNPCIRLDAPPALPAYCQQLATKSPLYIAIVIEQGFYPWRALFLQQFDKNGLINTSLEQHVPDIKPLIKQALFSEWEIALSFESHLENGHG